VPFAGVFSSSSQKSDLALRLVTKDLCLAKMRTIIIYILILACVSCRAARLGPYDTSATRDDDATAASKKIQIHIVPHSHDDAGWLKTVDQYYYGLRQDIQPAGVQYTLDTILMSLSSDRHRRFTFAEMAFFERWWNQQDEDTQSTVKEFVKEGRLNFVNGGYVQHDEAAAHYAGMVEQTTRGHRFLKKEFDIAPTVGWQVDPFGHSSIQAGLLGSALGFDAVFFGRADYQDMKKRSQDKELEHLWQGTGAGPSVSPSASSTLFTGNFPSGNYGPPPGFWWEWTSSPDAIIADDPDLKEFNVDERVNTFVQRCYELANVTRGNDIMLTMGSDFHYSNAHVWYKNLDKLIHYVNKDGRVNVFYSSPEDYVAAKYSYNTTWPVKYDDFFPYADTPHSYWTGYFSSRAASKGYIRSATAYLQAARQLEAYVGRGGSEQPSRTSFKSTTDVLEEAVALTQHHDSITGTAKQHVANDYHSRIYHGMEEAQKVIMHALSHLIFSSSTTASFAATAGGERGGGSGSSGRAESAARRLQMKASSFSSAAAEDDASLHVDHDSNEYAPVRLEGCFLLNISSCAPTVEMSRIGASIFLVAYNPLAWSRETPIRVPVSTSNTCHWKVFGPEGEEISSQLVPIAESTHSVQSMSAMVNATDPLAAGDAEIVFIGELPPLGYSSYIIEPVDDDLLEEKTLLLSTPPADNNKSSSSNEDKDTVSITNGIITVRFSNSSGLMSSISIANSDSTGSKSSTSSGTDESDDSSTTIKLSSSLRWYNASDGLDSEEDRGQASGAYIFRPSSGSSAFPIGQNEKESQTPLQWWCTTSSSFLSRFFSLRRGLFKSCYQPSRNSASPLAKPSPTSKLQIILGEEVSEVRQVFDFDDWATLITRLYKGQNYVEVEWTVGPIPFEDGLGREIILRYSSSIKNPAGNFFTDANGRAMMERKLNTRGTWDLNVTEDIAGNYYPVTAAAYIQDENTQLVVLTDRAQGGASLRQGEMEFMVHRRNLVDDRRGVQEPMNETMCGCIECDCPGLIVRGTHWLVLSQISESDSGTAGTRRRHLQQLLNDPPVLAFGHVPQSPVQGSVSDALEKMTHPNVASGTAASSSGGGGSSRNDTFFELQRSFSLTNGRILHRGAHLLTLMRTSAQTLLVRVAHLLDQGEEDSSGSGSNGDGGVGGALTEDLGPLLAQFHCSGTPKELTLSGNQLKRDSDRRRLKFKPGRSMSLNTEEAMLKDEENEGQTVPVVDVHVEEAGNGDGGSWLVHLKPLEVRTYEIDC
jgi:alpha-mannosidase